MGWVAVSMRAMAEPKKWPALGLILGLGALAAALYLQISKDWFPCPLCILQRYAYMLTALGFLGLLCFPRFSATGKTSALLTGFGVAGGLGLALYHVWVLSNPLQTCGVDPLQNTLNALPWVQLWPNMFMADGLCTDEYPPFFGLSLPMWSALGFVAQAVLLVLGSKRRRMFTGSW